MVEILTIETEYSIVYKTGLMTRFKFIKWQSKLYIFQNKI